MPKRIWYLGRDYETVIGGLAYGDEEQTKALIGMAQRKQRELPTRVRLRSPWALRNLIRHLPQERQDVIMRIALEMVELDSIQILYPDFGPPPDIPPEDAAALSALGP